MALNAQALLRNDELFEDVMYQYCSVMECSMCGFRKANIQCNVNAAGIVTPWNVWKESEVKKFE